MYCRGIDLPQLFTSLTTSYTVCLTGSICLLAVDYLTTVHSIIFTFRCPGFPSLPFAVTSGSCPRHQFCEVCLFLPFWYYFTPLGDVWSIVMNMFMCVCVCVCLSVCPFTYLENKICKLHHQFSLHLTCGHGSLELLWWHSDFCGWHQPNLCILWFQPDFAQR